MEYRVTCDGIPIGSTIIAPLAGLAHGELNAAPVYQHFRDHAFAACRRMNRVWHPASGDFAEQLAHGWEGGRLALTDMLGNELGVASVVIIEWESHLDTRPYVIVDARPDMARVEAFLRTISQGGDDRSRPAA